jgi:hypothetical protein
MQFSSFFLSKFFSFFIIYHFLAMASVETTPSKFVPRVLFPIFIAIAVSAVAYFGLRDCGCDERYPPANAAEAHSH